MPSQKDAVLAKLAVERGYLTRERIDEAFDIQQKMHDELGMDESLEQVLVGKKWLTADQAQELRHAVAVETGEARLVAGYEAVSKLGQGGMGAVYKARRVGTEDFVALKVLPPSLADKEMIARFTRESEIVKKLRHDNIVGCIEFGFDGRKRCHFCALELVEGEDLGKHLGRKGRLSEDEAVAITSQIAGALQHAYFNGLVHRDVKPENIMITPDGTAKLLDLGLARSANQEATRLTESGMFVGSPYYASPEQAVGEKEVDTRSDIYSLGATLYHMVTGKPPFEGTTALAILQKHVSEKLPWPAEADPDLSDGLCMIIAKMMEKSPDDRYQKPNELHRDLDLLVEGEEPEVQDAALKNSSVKVPAVRPRRRRRPAARARHGKHLDRGKRDSAREHRKGVPDRRRGRSAVPTGVKIAIPVLAGVVVAAVLGSLFLGRGPDQGPPEPETPKRPPETVAKPPPRKPREKERPSSRPRGRKKPQPKGKPPAKPVKKRARDAKPKEDPFAKLRRESEERLAGRVSSAPPPRAGGGEWRRVFDGKTLNCLIRRGGGAWRVKDGAITNVPGKNDAAQTKELFGDGQIRLRFQFNGPRNLFFAIRQGGAGSYGVYFWRRKIAVARGKPHELVFSCRGDEVSATLDGKPVPVEGRGKPRKGHLQFNTSVDLRIFSIDFRPPPVDGGADRPTAARPPSIPADAVAFGGHRYKLYTQKMKWHDAKRFCEAKGGQLVTITSKEENDFVTALARAAELDAWIGLTDEREEGTWEWASGEKVGLTFWHEGQPDDDAGGQDYGRLAAKFGFAWDDDHLRGRWSFVCEWEPGAAGDVATKAAPALPVDLTRGLVGHWKFDEGRGSAARDSSGRGYHARIGGAKWTVGKLGRALEFGGTDMVTLPLNVLRAVDAGDKLSVSMWIKPTSVESEIRLLDTKDSEGSRRLNVSVHDGGRNLWIATGGGKGGRVRAAPAWTAGEWQHFVLTYDGMLGAGTCEVYRNGAQNGRLTGGGRTFDRELIVGARTSGGGGGGFRGTIDDVRVYKHVLAPEEIEALHAAGLVPQPPSITSTAPEVAVADVEYSYTIKAAGDAASTITVKGLPAWLKFDGKDTISGTPGRQKIGVVTMITVTATNEAGSDKQRFPIKVLRADPSLVGWWKLDEGAGAVARDSSGKGNHGKIVGAKWAKGKIGGALEFDGKDDFVQLPATILRGSSSLTYAAWVRAARYTGKRWPAIIGGNTTSHSRSVSLGIWQNAERLHLEVDTDTGNYAAKGKIPLRWDTWVHVAVVYDGRALREHVDGVQGSSVSVSGRVKNLSLLHLGRTQDGAFRGLIDDARIYDRALSADAIRALAASK